ncbi:MAG: topoisomerase, partial [Alteromonas sp.]|nr:topoisomerase [Alteromonas sp.]
RCWIVKWPDGCKDANDVLVRDGKQALQNCIESAVPAPIEGLFAANECALAVRALYEEGLTGGASTGWIGLDMFYTVKPGEFTVITGVPNHGKTKFQTALMVNLAISSEWKFAVFSPENTPAGFIAHLASLYHGKPFRKGLTQRMTAEELETVLVWVNEHFCFIQPPDEELTIVDILIKAKQSVARYGINGLVIDPWNDIDHSRPSGMTGTEYISDCLTKIRRFAKKYNVHIWLVAHPAKMYKDAAGNYPVPTPYDI